MKNRKKASSEKKKEEKDYQERVIGGKERNVYRVS